MNSRKNKCLYIWPNLVNAYFEMILVILYREVSRIIKWKTYHRKIILLIKAFLTIQGCLYEKKNPKIISLLHTMYMTYLGICLSFTVCFMYFKLCLIKVQNVQFKLMHTHLCIKQNDNNPKATNGSGPPKKGK